MERSIWAVDCAVLVVSCVEGVPVSCTHLDVYKRQPREYLVCEHGLYTCQRAVLQDGWKMVHTFSPGLWDFAEYALYHTCLLYTSRCV